MDKQAGVEQQGKSLTIAKIYYQTHLGANAAQDYAAQRGLTPELLRKFEIGYAPDQWRGLVDHFTSHSMRLAGLAAGVITKSHNSDRLLDMFRDRMMFPIRTHDGVLVGYGGRLIGDKPKGTNAPPKYLNTPESSLFDKSKLLYGLHQNLKSITDERSAILVEGYTDVISLHGAAIPLAVAPMGTALTAGQLDLLLSLGVRKLWLCLDGDEAGQAATTRSLELIMGSYSPLLDIRVVQLPEDHDPDSFVRVRQGSAFRSLMDQALPVARYIESICLKGLPEQLGMEDKAIYLTRIEGYLDKASGTLQQELVSQACSITGLSPAQIAEGKYQRVMDQQAQQWHPVVGLAARLVWHEGSPEICEGILRVSLQAGGAQELRDLAQHRLDGSKAEGCQLLRAFAVAHGPLGDTELEMLRSEWGRWRREATLGEAIKSLRERPFDREAGDTIRKAFRLK